ncbi:MAG: precorrin-3B C(17)-methyltransferase [Gammaproteobacteria bacterium]|nr:precorrin-3B C(17)-methyltransferase [Gammaproteobacteria bacterium]MDH5802181.1 precorrin-3B C(17)-methyltransferase [Gammaproteobacteria bacterium]
MKNGKIFLVGFGPGAQEHMTQRALQAIEQSDVVIGYSTYINLVKHLLDGKEVVRKGMTEEIDRCVEAYEQAKLGKTVALISSGDIGVYGMAGPTYEVLLKSGWTVPENPDSGIQVEVIPGSTALSACASLVGAPLTHDFCSISLSDLLTPWPVIAKRLDAAAKSDFVIALYNPKSGRRTQHIIEAQRIIMQYRSANTPVAIVKSAYRDLQDIQMVTLDKMTECKIGMLTTVLIGNSSTYMDQGLMITPRGYANKYDDITGSTLENEKRGRSLSMGLGGWKSCVRQYLCDSKAHSLRDIARHFDMPMGHILSAISEADADSPAGEFKALALPPNELQQAIDSAKQWGRIRAVVRSDAGAVSELMIDAADFKSRGNWLNIENDHFHLHINWTQVHSAWLVSRGDSLRSVVFTDTKDESVFNVSLIREKGQFEPQALQQFEQLWQSYSDTEICNTEELEIA